MANFLQNYGSMLGLGAGLLPQLLGNLFGSSGQNFSGGDPNANFPASSTTDPSIGQSYTAPDNTSGYAGGGPSGITNLSQQNLPANTQNNNQNQMGGLQGLMSALNSHPMGIGGTTNSSGVSGLGNGGIQTITPAAIPAPNYSGTGPNAALLQQGLQALMGQGQGQIAPQGQMLGPAAGNPMMAFRPRF